VMGDVILLNGVFATDKSITSEFVMSGPGTSRWIQKPLCKVALGNVTVAAKHSVLLKGEVFGEISQGRSLQINEDAEFFCEQVIVKGEGTFTLLENAVLAIGHSEGIYSKGAKGNIQTAKRLFHSGATYYYYTASNPQESGVFETYPNNKTVAKLIVNKASTSQVLNLSQDFVVGNSCKVTLGDIRNNGFELKLASESSTAKVN